jgi:ligand-binding sensor domain-containing protein/serine phosphatase RsbU (regulator of sigma subunit)
MDVFSSMRISMQPKNMLKSAITVLLVLLIPNFAFAQGTDIKFKHISVEQGLSQSTVKFISQDKRGYMWFGTRDGLNKYDGYTISIYKHDPNKKESISDNFINNVFEDSRGELWIGTTKGLDRYDPEKDVFIHFPIGRPANVTFISEDVKGNLWVSTYSGLYLIDRDKNTFRIYSHNPKDPSSLIDNRINEVIADESGNLWLATMEGIEMFNSVTGKFKHYRPNIDNNKDISENRVETIYKDRKGNIWAGFIGSGLAFYNKSDDSFEFFRHDPKNSNSICHNEILSLMEDKEGKLWIGTQNGGISVFDYTNNIFKTLRQDIASVNSLTNNSIHSLYRDNQGNMWVGTWAGGVNLYSPYANKFMSYQNILDFDNPNVYCVTGDESGKIWLGKENAGLICFDRRNNAFRHLKDDNSNKMLTNVIFAMINANKDSLALAYHRGGFAFFNKRTEKFTHFLPEADNPNSIIGDTKTVLIKDSDNNYWIGSWGEGLHFYDKTKNKFINYAVDPDDPNSLSDPNVFALCEDKEKNIWVGTDNGLNMLDRRSGKVTHYLFNQKDQTSISHNSIYSIFRDSRDNLWIGTVGGLNLFDKKTQTFIRYTEKDGLPNDVINSVIEDSNGDLWLGTNKGISHFNVKTKRFKNYYSQDGLQGNEFNRNACYKAADGTIFFAGTKGVTLFHPDSIRTNPFAPPVELTSFQIFNKAITAGDRDSPLKKHISRTSSIVLPYSSSVFSFEFAALSFANSDKNQYAYKMEGFDKDWIYSGTRRLATYTNLDPGVYTFKVKASNNDAIWNQKGTSISIEITPPFWKTWWFRILSVFAAVSSAFIYYRARINKITKQKKLLEKEVTTRTSELRKANVDLQETYEKVNAQKEEIETQSEVLKDLYVELNSSIKAAESIQQTILTSGAYLKDYFPESFIFYKPKDVVSGDFYWFNEVNDAIVLAAVDCTGHGVSGAIMSIHAYHLLNLAIYPLAAISPDEVLERLNQIVYQEFSNKKENENEKVLAGMDIALCVIDKAKKSLQFSGAINPVYIVRDKEIIQIKGNKYPIGLVNSGDSKMFTKHEIELKKGDKVYIFSDGYSDQFGGAGGSEKFKYFRFRDLLISMSGIGMQDQESVLEETLNEWKGNLDQIDDILVIGVEI